MKNHFKKALLLVAISPFLMATTTLPEQKVWPDYYDEFSMNYVREELVNGSYNYYFHLENKGDGYIENINLTASTYDYYFSATFNSSDIRSPFLNSVISPNFNGEIMLTSSSTMPAKPDLYYSGTAYLTRAEEIKISGSKKVTLVQQVSYGCNYQVDLFLSNRNDDVNYYGAILEIVYKDETSFIKVDQKNNYYFQTSEAINLDELTVTNVIPIKSRYASTYTFWDCSSSLFNTLEVLFIISLIISIPVFCATFFPALARRRRNKEGR